MAKIWISTMELFERLAQLLTSAKLQMVHPLALASSLALWSAGPNLRQASDGVQLNELTPALNPTPTPITPLHQPISPVEYIFSLSP